MGAASGSKFSECSVLRRSARVAEMRTGAHQPQPQQITTGFNVLEEAGNIQFSDVPLTAMLTR
jgi:hypothetical protein